MNGWTAFFFSLKLKKKKNTLDQKSVRCFLSLYGLRLKSPIHHSMLLKKTTSFFILINENGKNKPVLARSKTLNNDWLFLIFFKAKMWER